MKSIAALVLIAGLANVAKAPSDSSAMRVEVKGPRIHAADIFPGAAEIDLGPTPPIGSTRVIEKADIEKAYTAANVPAPKKIPTAVKVSRKTRKLSALDVDSAVKTALSSTHLPRGAELVKVKSVATEVADDYDHVNVEFPPIPRRAGPATVPATVTFVSMGTTETPIYRTVIPLDISLPPEAAFADVPKNAAVTLIIRKGLVEITLPAVAALDADIGGPCQVMLKPSGRIIRGKAIDKDHVVAEDAQ